MSGKRGLVPIALAAGFGILNGYMIFNPVYAEREAQKVIESSEQNQLPKLDQGLKEVEIPNNVSAMKNQTTKISADQADRPPTWTRQIHSWWTGKNAVPDVPKSPTEKDQK